MSYYAKVVNNIVTEVIVCDSSIIGSIPGTWIETFIDGSQRANYAGIGYTYDSVNNVFYPPQPYASWTISAPTWQWTPPTPYPNDGKMYTWNENTKTWVLA